MDPYVHVCVFHKAIKANGERNDVDIINLFCFTRHDVISEWGENFMEAHPICKFKKVEAAFYKHYQNVHDAPPSSL
jgi:hypothetical protein